MILTSEQAEALPGPFVVDGDIHASSPDESRAAPPWLWADLDQPCKDCNEMGGADWEDCSCHGTGRKVVELRRYIDNLSGITDPLGLFTVRVRRHLYPPGTFIVIPTKVEP